MFWKKNEQKQSEIDLEIYKRMANVEAKVENVEQLLKNLRGLVNRKLGNEPKDEDLNNSDVLLRDGFPKVFGR